jgi:hypothetical protein
MLGDLSLTSVLTVVTVAPFIAAVWAVAAWAVRQADQDLAFLKKLTERNGEGADDQHGAPLHHFPPT